MLTRNALWISVTLATMVAACGGSGADCPEGMVKRGDVCAAEDAGGTDRNEDPSTASGGRDEGGKAPGQSSKDAGAPDVPADDAGFDAEAPCTGPVYRDTDGDGFGNPAVSSKDCSVVMGWVRDNTDCDDDSNSTHPDAGELCDNKDNDCDGQIDDNATVPHWKDCDKDGYAPANAPSMVLCRDQPPAGTLCAWVEREPKDENNTDCNDGRADMSPAKDEICDDFDNNCRDGVDEGLKKIYYTDNDGDGFGVDASATILLCEGPAGSSEKGGDCNDDPARGGKDIKPSAPEVCDYIDNNCNTQVDETLQTARWYADCDRDGFVEGKKQERIGCPNVAPPTPPSCGALSGQWVDESALTKGNDCDDARSDTYPFAPAEVCDETGHVEKCETLKDPKNANELLKVDYFLDCDGDHHLASGARSITQCPATARSPANCGPDPKWIAKGDVAPGVDCRDDLRDAFTGHPEVCDDGANDYVSIDHDCSGTDNDGRKWWYADCDGDAHLSATPYALLRCSAPSVNEVFCGGTNGTPTWQVGGNRDDCADLDYRAYGGSEAMGTEAPNGASKWDWNCDGAVTRVPYETCGALTCIPCAKDTPNFQCTGFGETEGLMQSIVSCPGRPACLPARYQ